MEWIFKLGDFTGERDDADVHRAIFNFLDYLAAEVAVDADLHRRV